MRKIFMSSLMLLAFAVLTTGAGFATEVELATPDRTTQPDVSVEQPLMTPAEHPQFLAFVDFGRGPQESRIRVCDPVEELQCPPGCNCVIIRDEVACFCG